MLHQVEGEVWFCSSSCRGVSNSLAKACMRGVVALSPLEDGTPVGWQLVQGAAVAAPQVRHPNVALSPLWFRLLGFAHPCGLFPGKAFTGSCCIRQVGFTYQHVSAHACTRVCEQARDGRRGLKMCEGERVRMCPPRFRGLTYIPRN